MIPSPVIALGLMTRLQGGGGWVDVRRHETDHEARRMREQSPLPFDGLTLPMVVDRLREQAPAKQKTAGWANGVRELDEAILLAGACGRDDLVEDGVELARSLSKKWQDKWYERWNERQRTWQGPGVASRSPRRLSPGFRQRGSWRA